MPEENLIEIDDITPEEVSRICDHTFLNRPESYRGKADNPVKRWEEKFEAFLIESVGFTDGPYAVCVRPETVAYAKNSLGENEREDIKVASVVAFPNQEIYSPQWKIAETKLAIDGGADEIDFIIQYRKLKQGEIDEVKKDAYSINSIIKSAGLLSKLILETSELTPKEIISACKIAQECGIDFVKTSSGFVSGGATVEALKTMRNNFLRGIKISGGVNLENYKELLKATSGRDDGYIELNPLKIRIGESSLFGKLFYSGEEKKSY